MPLTHFAFHASLVDNLINVVCGHTWLDCGRRKIQNFPRQTTNLSHAFLLFFVENGNVVAPNELLFRPRNAIFGVVGVWNGLGDWATGRKRVNRTQGSGERVRGKRIVLAGSWIWFRNYFWGENVAQDIVTLGFVDGFVRTLQRALDRSTKKRRVNSHTQLRLKQSCEQKKLSVPAFKQVGHCKVPASLGHSTPIHLRGATAAAMTEIKELAENRFQRS